MKNIHIIPTDKPSKFVKDNVMYDYYFYLDVKIKSNLSYTAQNIYITNDEEIREGDWYLGFETNYSKEPKERWVLYNCVSKPNGDYSEKIILTTDQDLIKDGVQEIPEYFLIHYIVGNNPIEYVEIKEHLESIDTMKINYELIIPKEEPKERLKKILGTKHPKQEINLEDIFNEEKKKGVKELIDKHKQETLEEALNKFVRTMLLDQSVYIDFLQCAEFGAKWQQERMYSEEEVIAFGEFIFKHSLLTHTRGVKSLFEQFKKK